jgi:hypothetical protein
MLNQKVALSAEVGRSFRSVIGEFYPVFVFYGLYATVVYLYDWLQPFKPLPVMAANLIQFATSPFSFIEATPPYSSSTIMGLYNNFLFVALLMVFLAMYNLTLSRRLKRPLSLPRVFGGGVAATYAVSGAIWILTGQPSTGTSIIGFTTVTALALASATDLSGQLRRIYVGNRKAMEYVRAYVWLIVFGIASLIALGSYVLGNQAYPLHLVGGTISSIPLVLWAWRTKAPDQPALGRRHGLNSQGDIRML